MAKVGCSVPQHLHASIHPPPHLVNGDRWLVRATGLRWRGLLAVLCLSMLKTVYAFILTMESMKDHCCRVKRTAARLVTLLLG